MAREGVSELEAFRDFVDQQIESGQADQSPENVLRQWQIERAQLMESVRAVKEGLEDMDAGDTGRPLREFMEEFKAANNQRMPSAAKPTSA
jgi:hypothetical protein